MVDKQYYRSVIRKVIDEEKAVLSAKRVVKTDDEYGGNETEEIGIVIEGRFYGGRSYRTVSKVAGIVFNYHSTADAKLLTMPNEDVQTGDVFEHNGHEYRVRFINNYLDVCLQCDLEVVGYD